MTEEAPAAAADPLASVHTLTLAQIFSQAGISLAITTYQAGKLILARADGDVINTHFRTLSKPMGMVADGARLVVGTTSRIVDFRNVPSAAKRLKPADKHTACYLPRATHTTGDIDIHEMALLGDDVYFINTRFSCLCKLDRNYSFEPVWKPSFISAYDVRDRCHLNGLAVRDGKLRYVSALATTDEPAGWRQHKAAGGVIIDITNDAIVADKLSMPHSPRWHMGQLWFLESGTGSLIGMNTDTGRRTFQCELPGFTRGLDFYQNLAFVGISQVRETAVFSGLKVTKENAVRDCGVWVVDLNTGKIIGFLKFTGGVQEIFAVSVLPHSFPEVVLDNEQLNRSTYVIPDQLIEQAVSPDANWQSAESIFEQGNQQFNQGRLDSAVALYQKALEIDASFLPARYYLGLAYRQLESLDEAEQTLLAVVEQEAGHVEAMNVLGCLYAQRQQHELARKYLEKALEIRPDFDAARQNLRALPAEGG